MCIPGVSIDPAAAQAAMAAMQGQAGAPGGGMPPDPANWQRAAAVMPPTAPPLPPGSGGMA